MHQIIVPILSLCYGFLMKISDLMSIEHGLRLINTLSISIILKTINSIIVGLIFLQLFSFNTYIGLIFLFYILSFLFRGKIDDFNHLITFVIIIAGLIYKLYVHSIQLIPLGKEILLFGTLFILFFIWPTIFGSCIHDKDIMNMRKNGKRKDIKNAKTSSLDNGIDIYEVMKSEIPHSFYVYLIPALVFYLIYTWLKVEKQNLDILVLTSVTFFIVGYEIARFIGTKKLKKEREKE